MPGKILIIGFQGWMNAVFGTIWTYLFLGGFFAVVLSGMLISTFYSARLSSKNKNKKQEPPPPELSGNEIHLFEFLHAAIPKPKTVLLAAAGLDCLPVTIPIRLALLSCRSQQRCLLIDLDTKRDAVWKAFARPSSNNSSPLPISSGIENLFLIPAHYFEQTRQMNLAPLIHHAKKHYDLILINAPYLDGHPDRHFIVSWAEGAFVFAKEASQARRLITLCQSRHCKVLGCYKPLSPASVVSVPSKEAAPASAIQMVR